MKVSIKNAVFLSFLASFVAASENNPSQANESDMKCSAFYEKGMVGQNDMKSLIENDEHGLHDHLLALSKMQCDAEGKMDFETEEKYEEFMKYLKLNYENLMSHILALEKDYAAISLEANEESLRLFPENVYLQFNRSAQPKKQEPTIMNKLLRKGPNNDAVAERRKMYADRRKLNDELREQLKGIRAQIEPLAKKTSSVEAFMNHCYNNGCYRVLNEKIVQNDSHVVSTTCKFPNPIKSIFRPLKLWR